MSDHSTDADWEFLRPIGDVADDPILAPLDHRGLYLGNRHAADPERHGRRFAAVVSVSTDAYPLTTHHRPLTDGEGNDWRAFAAALDAVRRLARREGDVLVHCKAGVSRSATVLATAVAAGSGGSFRDGLVTVERARPQAVPHPALVELGVVYLAANG
ncbi:dual specificity protein phosphatase family protein [Halolamina sp. CBA1230]|uniref:protein-tyrosine phosphatase family protein n=1 Tax=Halolamina sp. CBA1230 TaxID=1853690 RepID=UPI0009A20619|nr:dual specificity protein phosphatase family protein [Halolamina sp. CBA1230]QKY19396.1 dual specificity protein phosphatase family protein [Halolamina sp. CBA1230]